MKVKVANGESVAKRAFYIAWKACGEPFGMGYLQDNPDATEDDVWENVQRGGDYTFGKPSEDGTAYGDYVFGRMVKLRLTYGDDWVAGRENIPNPEFNAWAKEYPTYEQLIERASEEIKNDRPNQ